MRGRQPEVGSRVKWIRFVSCKKRMRYKTSSFVATRTNLSPSYSLTHVGGMAPIGSYPVSSMTDHPYLLDHQGRAHYELASYSRLNGSAPRGEIEWVPFWWFNLSWWTCLFEATEHPADNAGGYQTVISQREDMIKGCMTDLNSGHN